MKFQGGDNRRGKIQGRGARKAKAPICVMGDRKALTQIHPEPRRCEIE